MSDPIHDQELAMAIKPMVGVATVVAAAFGAALTLAGAANSTVQGKQLKGCAACTHAPYGMHPRSYAERGQAGRLPVRGAP